MKEEKKLYNCSYELLYIICRLGWAFCSQYLADFAGFRAKYTPAYILAALAAVDAADSIEDIDVRNARAKKAKIALDEQIKLVCNNWQELKRYTLVASTPATEAVNLQLAGFSHYARASRGKWEAAAALIKNANTFITKNLDMLLADDNMPADFATRFKAAGQDCGKLAEECLDIERNKPINAKDKSSASNEIYNDLMVMFADSQRVFKTAKMRRQFTVTYLTRLANGTRAGSIRGAVVDAFTGKPIENALLTVENETLAGTSGKNGRYNIKKVAGGSYMVSAQVAGYQPVTVAVTVKPGTAATANVSLAAIEHALKVA